MLFMSFSHEFQFSKGDFFRSVYQQKAEVIEPLKCKKASSINRLFFWNV